MGDPSVFLITQLLLHNAMVRQAPAWRIRVSASGACIALCVTKQELGNEAEANNERSLT